MTATILDLANIINVTIQGAPSLLSTPNVNTIALISSEVPLDYDVNQAFRIYKTLTDVATDWGTGSLAFQIATGFFSQQPNPLGTNGYLTIIPRLQTPSLESVEDAIVRTINLVYYAGVLIDGVMDGATFATLAAYVQGIDKLFFYASAIKADFAPGGLLDLLRTRGQTHTRGLYYNDGTAIDTQVMAASYASRGMSTDFSGSLTTQTLNLKVLTGIEPDTTLDETDIEAAQTAGVDVYVNFGGLPSCYTSGKNGWFDEIYNELWFKLALQVAGFNFLRGTNTKIPQTEIGMDGLKNAYRIVCQQAVVNGFLAPGAWTSPDVFGNPPLLLTAVFGIGYYIFSSPLALQPQQDREDRQAPLVQIAVKAAGAIQKSNVIVAVNL